MNEKIFLFLNSFANQSVVLDRVIVFTAEVFPYFVVLFALAFIFFHEDTFPFTNLFKNFKNKCLEAGVVFFSSGLAWFFSKLLKSLIQIERPFVSLNNVSSLFGETGYAFPSGHTTFFAALGFALFLRHKKAGYYFLFFALLIGLARIMAGVHFPVDILGGFVLGYLVSLGVAYLAKSV